MLNGYESDTTMLTQFKTHISNFNVRQVKKVYLQGESKKSGISKNFKLL